MYNNNFIQNDTVGMSKFSAFGAPSIIRETSQGWDRIRIEDEMLRSREIFLVDDVDAASMESLMKQFMYLIREDPDKEITLYINSPGGEVRSGLAVYDFMKLTKTPIRTVCVGMAASMGAILFLAGDKREMLPHSQIMIHDPSMGGGSMQGMKPDELSERLENLKKVKKVLCEVIAETTGNPIKSVQNKTRKDSYFDAQEAVKFGLATAIINEIDYKKGGNT